MYSPKLRGLSVDFRGTLQCGARLEIQAIEIVTKLFMSLSSPARLKVVVMPMLAEKFQLVDRRNKNFKLYGIYLLTHRAYTVMRDVLLEGALFRLSRVKALSNTLGVLTRSYPTSCVR